MINKLSIKIFTILLCMFSVVTAQESAPTPATNTNWVSSISYNISGETLSKSVGFFNTLGKPTQSQSWDVLSKKVWGSETLYDYHGRPALQTLSAPLNSTAFFGYDSQFITENSGNYDTSDFDTGTFIENPKTVSATSKLGTYYWNNTTNTYQDNTNYPYSRTIFSKLNPGGVKKVLGGNKLEGEWKQAYSFSMDAGNDDIKSIKTVSRDVHGIETISIADIDGNLLSVARSGNEENTSTPTPVTLTIKEQGFTDIHIPKGCSGIMVSNPESIALRIYDLVTENHVAYATANYALQSGVYRIAARYPGTYIYNAQQPITITHTVNYYESASNKYDKARRLLVSKQPNGGTNTFRSIFGYNSLGQLLTTTSPDEGTAQFIYRKDGQIRFSQNSKQSESSEFSYTNYDRLGRPVESGVYKGNDLLFYLASETPTVPTPIDTTPYTITLANSHNVVVQNSSQSTSPVYKKANISGVWNAGLISEEVIEENGTVGFKSGDGSGISAFGIYRVVVGLSGTDITQITNPTSIKYGIQLDNTFGNTSISIFEDGVILKDSNNQAISYGTYMPTDVFKVKRTNGVITYLKNGQIFYNSLNNNLNPLKVSATFLGSNNAIHNLKVAESNATLVSSSTSDIQALVDAQDGLDDSNCFEQHFTLYDIPDTQFVQQLNTCSLPVEAYKQTFLSSNVSRTYTQSPETTTTWYSYDVYGRVKWLVQKINGLDCLKTIDYSYDPITGQVVKVDYQRHVRDERFVHRYEYNIGGQLIKVSTSVNDVDYVEQAEYKYNEIGQLIRTELADNLQGIDYVYNLKGQLKAINHPSLNATNDPGHDGTNGFVSDVFGMTLQYHTNDYTRTNTPTPIPQVTANTPNQFNGNIQAIQWQNQTGGEATYSYDYNKNNWLKSAQFSSTANPNAQDYNVSNITYDANGNIKTLKRNGYTDASGTNAMDDFTYRYKPFTNQLKNIDDANDNTNANRYNDLKDQKDNNYTYNNIGQLVVNKQDKVLYEYNAAGLVTKISQFNDSDSNNYHTLLFEDYENSNNIIDVSSNSSLVWNTPGALPRLVVANQEDQTDTYSGLLPIGVNAEDIKLPEYCVDFDANTTYQNRLQFNYYPPAVGTQLTTFVAQTNLSTVKNAYHKLGFDLLLFQKQFLRTTLANPTGTLNINAGATITLQQQDGTTIETIVIAPQNYTQEYCDRIIDRINFNFLATGDKVKLKIEITNNGLEPTVYVGNPAGAYSIVYQSAEVDNIHLQVASKAKLAFYYNDRGQRVRKESYVGSELVQTIYVRDASGSPMAIYHRPGRAQLKLKEHPVYGASRIGVFYKNSSLRAGGSYVYQLTDHLGNVRAVVTKSGSSAISLTNKTDYYPFGMPMSSRNIEGGYRYGYQGDFAEKDSETGLNAFELRLWDSRIGRWLTRDPMGEFHSPYLGMGNNPISKIDPTGGMTDDPPTGAGSEVGETHFDPDTGNTYEWDGSTWHSDMAGGFSFSEVVIGGNSNTSNSLGYIMIPTPLAIAPVIMEWPPKFNGVALWGSGGKGGEEFGRRRRSGERITESYDNLASGMPGGNGAQLTRWKHLANTGVDAIEMTKYITGVAGQVNDLSSIGLVEIAPTNAVEIKTTRALRLQTTVHRDKDNNIIKISVIESYVNVPITSTRTRDSVKKANDNMRKSVNYSIKK
ncbi:RHS repeat domain-containing protein [Tenacibaculum halocynthiae]|uniref:RHS repeat domain-containing protein n=1 Tax=Tenacibaculum halocynthiae TaxID=1254437 RepID=UPI003D64F4B3